MNINKEWFTHIIDSRRFPNKTSEIKARQEKVNAGRLARVEKAMYRMPVYIPLKWVLPAIAPISPITATTNNKINFDVLIVGAISDCPNRQIRFKSSNNEINPSYLGKDVATNLVVGDIAGTTMQYSNDAQIGIFEYTSPFILYPNNQLTIEMYKDTTDNEEISNLVFVGYRIFSEKFTFTNFQEDEIKEIKGFISQREIPRQKWLKHEIKFDAEGFASDVLTPDIDEPLIIRGIRTDLKHSVIQRIKFQNHLDWLTEDTPIWAIASETRGNGNYHYFKQPLYLPRKSAIQIDLKNTIDGTSYIDGDGSITWLCETV